MTSTVTGITSCMKMPHARPKYGEPSPTPIHVATTTDSAGQERRATMKYIKSIFWLSVGDLN